MKKGKLRIIWAVDAFESAGAIQPHVVKALMRISERASLEIEPVHVLSPESLILAQEFTPEWVRESGAAAKEALTKRMEGLGLRGVLPPRVILVREVSRKAAIQALARHARRAGADFIVVGTHARRGLTRLVMGSFAESALLHSNVPVLVVGPRAIEGKLGHILFATDFGKRAGASFQGVLALARATGSKLTIFHATRSPFEPVIESSVYLAGGGWVPLSDIMGGETKASVKTAEKWLLAAKKRGVLAEVIRGGTGNGITDSILECARKRRANVIAMAAESGPVASAFIGSVTRQVVRKARCPVWVTRASG